MHMTGLALRDYQQECLNVVGPSTEVQRAVVVLPTGSGKTVIFSHLAEWYVNCGYDVLILVHRDELIRQTVAKLNAVLGVTDQVGVIQAERNDLGCRITVASVPTLVRDHRLSAYMSRAQDRDRLVIVDEAHHAVADSYTKILRTVGCFDSSEPPRPVAKTVGFTATLMRSDGLGLGDVWQKIAYQRTIKDMIEAGWLVDVRGKTIPVEDLDLNTVKRSAGDLASGDLGETMLASMALETTAKAYVEQAGDRLGVAFWPTVDVAEQAVQVFDDQGVTSAVVTGSTPHEERQTIYADQAHGRVRVVHNCMVLTEGWDSPPVSCCVVGRPTQSTGLYIQMVGRVLRPWPAGGKKDALVLDVVGAARRNSLATLGALTTSPSRDLVDGESLLEFELAEAELKQDVKRKLLIRSHMVDVDLFAASTTAWLKTAHGVWFINVHDGWFFLFEERDNSGYTLGWAPKTGKSERLSDPLPLDMAIALGESQAMAWDPSLASKTSSWRKRKAKATEKQLAVLGDAGWEGMTKQEASDLISVRFATPRLKWAARPKGK